MVDFEAYAKYPQFSHFYDKLWVAKQQNVLCGTSEDPIPSSNTYVVKPIINLYGMGMGARYVYLEKGSFIQDDTMMWCEVFDGDHVSVDYKLNKEVGMYVQNTTVKGYRGLKGRDKYSTQFYKWERINKHFVLPTFVEELDVDVFNIEFIGDKIIEIHLRSNPDFLHHGFRALHVITDKTTRSEIEIYKSMGYFWVADRVECEDYTRLGFFGAPL